MNMNAIAKLIAVAEETIRCWRVKWPEPGAWSDALTAMENLGKSIPAAKAAMEAKPTKPASTEAARYGSATTFIDADGSSQTMPKPATRWLNRKRIDQFLNHVGRDLEAYTTELLDAHDAARQEREESAKPTDAQIVAALAEAQRLMASSKTGACITIGRSDGNCTFGNVFCTFAEAVAKLRELATPKPRTLAETWALFKAGKFSTAKEHNQFRAWMAKQEPMVRKVFRRYMESADATAKELLDAWMTENGNVPMEPQVEEN